jgi:hypothetical protein
MGRGRDLAPAPAALEELRREKAVAIVALQRRRRTHSFARD